MSACSVSAAYWSHFSIFEIHARGAYVKQTSAVLIDHKWGRAPAAEQDLETF